MAAEAGPALLARRFPRLGAALPWLALADLPTPLDAAPGLAAMAGAPDLRIKRDDRTSPRYGGNKVRKLEYLLADARARDCDTVVTFGAAGSNHVLATSVFARTLGLRCVGVLTPQPPTRWLERTLRHHRWLGTEIVPALGYADGTAILERIRVAHPRGPSAVCDIPWGGSSWRGATGYVAAALELAAQYAAAGVGPPHLAYLACGTAGTTAGLALGLRLAGLPTRVVAVRVTPPAVASPARIAELVGATHRELRALDPAMPPPGDPLANVEFRDEFYGEGYAVATPAAEAAVATFAREAGVRLETTYTGKAAAALLADGAAGRLAGLRVVFLNTYSSAPVPAEAAAMDLDGIPPELLGG